MKLHDNQLQLLRHLARFNLLDYGGCLKMLDVDETGDRTALSYAFRPLTKTSICPNGKMAAMRQKPRGCCWCATETHESRQLGILSGKPCGAVVSCFKKAA